MEGYTIVSVSRVAATAEEGVYIVSLVIGTPDGSEIAIDYASRPDGVVGINPLIRQWLADNQGSYAIEPYTPPAPENP